MCSFSSKTSIGISLLYMFLLSIYSVNRHSLGPAVTVNWGSTVLGSIKNMFQKVSPLNNKNYAVTEVVCNIVPTVSRFYKKEHNLISVFVFDKDILVKNCLTVPLLGH